ncbi:TOBE domain-containing protein [Paraburkholderia sp. UCT2]|uniref:TOBE domain-containing protein n=1 Tax=Paraburkholderia sp. UCT2 TaxID=2615208 RepID=UPI0016567554|nr:TOBE domain-containing protein [Paraburkholderia sp. UCT2]MBC8730114.1 LysR family transcriptional regulator [Paraburkholderia sp. UCT2]
MTVDRPDPPRDALELGGSVWFQAGTQTLGGAARIALLAAIGETGSITSAAKAVGISYKGAWDAIDTMNNLAGEPLVVRLTGGKGGGGTTLTPRAVKLIETFRAVEREHRRFLERAGAAIGEGFATDWDLIGRIGVKTSARNQFYGTVSAIERGTVNDEVSLALPGGHTIVAVLTHESTEALGLAVGVAAFALIKASWVVLLVPGDGDRDAPLNLSARNQLSGTVHRVKRGAVNAEVSLGLEGGAVVTAVVTNGSVDMLGLQEGASAVAVFKASSVILGVKD